MREFDWSKPNVQLAKEHNLSRERIRQLRLKYGAEKPPRSLSTFREKLRLMEANAEVWRGRKMVELSKLTGLSFSYPPAREAAVRLGLAPVPKKINVRRGRKTKAVPQLRGETTSAVLHDATGPDNGDHPIPDKMPGLPGSNAVE